MAKVYRGALIGCGYASWFQLTAWSRIENVEIVALASRRRENAQRRAIEFNIPAIYTDYRQMLDAEALDFVDIATPPIVHLEMISEAAKRGLQVLCQKPIASTLAELREMIRICDEAGVTFIVNENGRFQPWYRQMKKLLDAGAIGRPFYANFTSRARMTLPTMDAGGQTDLFSKMSQLVLYELGVHFLDTLRYLFGEATSVYAQTRRISPHIAGEDLATLTLQIGEIVAAVDMSWVSLPAWEAGQGGSWAEVRLEGERGTLHLQKDGLLRLITDDGQEVYPFPLDSEVKGYQNAQQHFVDCLRSGAEAEISGTATLKTMELVFGAYDAAAHNRVYTVRDDIKRLD